ncbi:MAG: GNAT family N-acetyltransferase [Gammaproteobacteria bacterium]|nr:GNAT family N-acetyltransferase [Gammaproteobacteria bacterium]
MKNADQSLMFPLNVYSSLMRLHAGQVPFLSYGDLSASDIQALSNSAAASKPARLAALLIEAQWRRADRLLERVLPKGSHHHDAGDHSVPDNGPAGAFKVSDYANHLRVLEVGCGSGELAHMLAVQGHDVCAIDKHAAAINTALADGSLAGKLEFVVCEFENFEDRRGFDLLIFNNSTRYFLPLTLFYKALTLLRAGGQLLICEEFASNTMGDAAPDSLPVQNHVVALAERLGFDVLSVDDLTDSTHRFQQVFATLFGTAVTQLPALADVPSTVIDDLYQALQADAQAAQQGRRRHALISLRAPVAGADNSLPAGVYLRSAAELAPASFKNVFERSFEVDFNPALWDWKYSNGRGASVVAERDGQVIAHYGGIVRSIYYFSRPTRAAQICDVMVMPDERSFFSRNTLFFKTAASMLEQFVGYRAENLLGFGFPNIKAMHIAERLGLYEKTDELMQIALDNNSAANSLPGWVVEPGWVIEKVELMSVLPLAQTLWATMLSAFADDIIGVRDASYLYYRFVQRPGLDYDCLRVSLNGNTKALVFTRPHYDGYLIMDIVAAVQDMPAVLQTSLQPRDGKSSVFWLTAGQLGKVQRGSSNLAISKTGIQIPCNRWSRGPGTAKLAGKWWLTAGDMDFL